MASLPLPHLTMANDSVSASSIAFAALSSRPNMHNAMLHGPNVASPLQRDSQANSLGTSTFATACAFTAAVITATTRGLGRRVVRRRAGKRARVVMASSAKNIPDVGVVLLAAGVGKRMGAQIPKQFIKLLGKEIALWALDAFLDCRVKEIVVVCSEDQQHIFTEHLESRGQVRPEIKFARGGAERQNSVQNGLAKITAEFVAVHDSARPLVTPAEIEKVVADARKHGAALLAVPTKATIKQAAEASADAMVAVTPDRSLVWEAHTPQVIRADLLRCGFEHAEKFDLAVTDDVSLVELLGKPVRLTLGEYTNIKVTTPEDIAVAESILTGRDS